MSNLRVYIEMVTMERDTSTENIKGWLALRSPHRQDLNIVNASDFSSRLD